MFWFRNQNTRKLQIIRKNTLCDADLSLTFLFYHSSAHLSNGKVPSNFRAYTYLLWPCKLLPLLTELAAELEALNSAEI